MTVQHRMSARHYRALAALVQAENGTLPDGSLRAAIGSHATNVIRSLEDRKLIYAAGGFWDDDDGEPLWTLTSRGSLAWSSVAPKDRPVCCSKCGQLMPARRA